MRNEPPAFDLWLRRDLRQKFDPVLRDPIPAELLDAIEAPGTSH